MGGYVGGCSQTGIVRIHLVNMRKVVNTYSCPESEVCHIALLFKEQNAELNSVFLRIEPARLRVTAIRGT